MKREILFRGKGFGKWHYGSLLYKKEESPVQETNAPYIETYIEYAGLNAPMVEVSPDTIGQYTGLKDKNGNKIFEGDIVHLKGDGYDGFKVGKDYYRVVTFHEGSFCFSIEDGVHYPVHTPIYEYSDSHNIVNWDVIGNVTDNPELIK